MKGVAVQDAPGCGLVEYESWIVLQDAIRRKEVLLDGTALRCFHELFQGDALL